MAHPTFPPCAAAPAPARSGRIAAAAALLCVAALSGQDARAESPAGAREFETYVEGRTLTFEVDGVPYGIERYMAGREVLWSFLDGDCAIGSWYPDGEAICFVYDTDPDRAQCWLVYLEPGGMRTVLRDDPGGGALYEASEGGDMICQNFGF